LSADLNILVGIHFDVVERRIGQRCEGREDAGQALRSDAGRMDVGHIHAPLLPPHRHQVRADEGQQTLTRALPALAKQHVGLVDAVNGSVIRNLGANDIGEGREEIHDREHGIRGCIRLGLARPADEATCSDRAFGCFSQLATKWTRVAHVRRALISQIADDLTFRPVVRGEDEKRVVVDIEVFQRLEDPADVVVAFHHSVTILANPRLPRKLLRRQVRKMPHGEWQVEEERLARERVRGTGQDDQREGRCGSSIARSSAPPSMVCRRARPETELSVDPGGRVDQCPASIWTIRPYSLLAIRW